MRLFCRSHFALLAFHLLFVFVAFLPSMAGATPAFSPAVTNGTVDIAGLAEASGVCASRNNSNVLWTHNDSGHPAVVYAIDTQGQLIGTYATPANQDTEDIAIGPGPVANISYLYVGDIGDNSGSRDHIQVYQIPEPAVYARQATNPFALTPKGTRTMFLTYPDGPRDAESLFVDPISGDLFILSKESTSRIYTAPKALLDSSTNITLTFVRTLAFNVPSGADISPSGNEIVVRQENFATLWQRSASQTVSNAFGGTGISIPVTGTANGEPNGEAIGFDSSGSGYFTLSDSATVQPLRYFPRTSLDGPLTRRTLVSAGSTWKFLDNGSNQGNAWRYPSFDDSFWPTGVAQFGYGDGDEETVLSFGGNPNNKFVTTWFRKQFAVFNAAGITNLTLKMVVDDGAAVYLNGTRVVLENLGADAPYNALASAMPVSLQSTWHPYNIEPRLLSEGTNTLAVELHQSSLSGSNVSFDLQLQALIPAAYEPFDYPVGLALTALTNAAGEWWSAAGPNGSTGRVVSGSLVVPGLASSHAASMQFGAVDGPSARFNFLANVTNRTVYFSFPCKVSSLGALTTNGGWVAGFNNSRGAQGNTPTVLGTRILMRSTPSGEFNIGVAKNTTSPANFVWNTTDFALNQTIFLVGSYTLNPVSSSDDVSLLWINPNLSQFGAVDPPTPTLVASSGSDVTANQVASFVFLQQGANNTNQPGAMLVDELRIGPNWASVTPKSISQPVLTASRLGDKLILSWPTNAIGFLLEASPALLSTSVWTNVLSPVTTVEFSFTTTNDVLPVGVFYRLSRAQ